MQFAYITLRLHCAAAAALRRRRVPAGRPRSQPPEPLDLGLDRDMQWSGRSDSCMSSRPVVSETLQLPAALGAHAARVEIVLVHEADRARVRRFGVTVGTAGSRPWWWGAIEIAATSGFGLADCGCRARPRTAFGTCGRTTTPHRTGRTACWPGPCRSRVGGIDAREPAAAAPSILAILASVKSWPEAHDPHGRVQANTPAANAKGRHAVQIRP